MPVLSADIHAHSDIKSLPGSVNIHKGLYLFESCEKRAAVDEKFVCGFGSVAFVVEVNPECVPVIHIAVKTS